MMYTLDLETTTDEQDCRAWAWGVCEIGNPENFAYGNSLDTLFKFMQDSYNASFFIHNMKFDSDFLFVYLFEHGFKHVTRREDEASKTFTTLISDKGQFYSAKIIFKKQGKKTSAVKIYDSLKSIPFSVDKVAKAFGLPINKLKLDYKAYREIGHELTPHEVQYLRHDVEIMARALHILHSQGLDKMTQASNAFHDYVQTVGKKNFDHWFPMPDYEDDEDMRQAYRGGFTYLNPRYREIDIGEGLVLDVNSLYPWVLRDCKLPFGKGIYFEGKYEPDPLYDLYIQMFSCAFELKPGHIPTVQLKHVSTFVPTEYLESSNGQIITMCMSSVDFELFMEHYNVFMPNYISGWKFKSTVGLFTPYIDKWTENKIQAKKEKNKGMYTLSKLMLNALYGRFALNPNVASKIPYYDEGIIKYRQGEKEKRKSIYIPVGVFVTAWARNKTIRSAQKVYDLFAYADTDSLHLNIKLPEALSKLSNDELEEMTTADLQRHGVPLPDDFIVDPYALGAWKVESRFTRARFLRQKSYVEDWNPPDKWEQLEINSKEIKEICEEFEMDYDMVIKSYKGYYDKALLNITCAGMPERCYDQVTWDNFRIGSTYGGKLQPKHVKGGIVLRDTDFTIKRA